jgi:hypothetical protein
MGQIGACGNVPVPSHEIENASDRAGMLAGAQATSPCGNRMNLLEQLTKVYKNLASLGQAKLAMLAGAAVVSIGLVLAAGILVNMPARSDAFSISWDGTGTFPHAPICPMEYADLTDPGWRLDRETCASISLPRAGQKRQNERRRLEGAVEHSDYIWK